MKGLIDFPARGRPHRLQRQVRAFYQKFGLSIGDRPALITHEQQQFRLKLINEELRELQEAFLLRDLAGQVAECGDLLYVVYGTLIELGVEAAPVTDLIHDANMAKVGGPVRFDGKILKPPGWKPADIEGEVRRQICESF